MTEDARYPTTLSEAGRGLLKGLLEHAHAPRYNHGCGDRLTAAGLARVRAFESRQVDPAPFDLEEFVRFCLREVPFYRARGGDPTDLRSIPPCAREDLSREPWSFVPDSQSMDELILYTTSGTTGHPLQILSHPEVSSMFLPLLRRALALHGVGLEGRRGAVALVLVCFQRSTYTYASVSTYLDESGFVKLNLHPGDWNDPDDRVRFLDSCAPEVYTGDPISFGELARLPLKTRPKALVSTSMALSDGLRRELEARFSCPVVDVYSMNESGPVAVRDPGGTFRVLPKDLHVEVVDGEIVLTGGHNPFLPLLRYRTGDTGRLLPDGGLVDLQGREPVVFETPSGERINNIEVARALKELALSEYSVTQLAGGALVVRARGVSAVEPQLRDTFAAIFGASQRVDVEEITSPPQGKLVPFRRESASGLVGPGDALRADVIR